MKSAAKKPAAPEKSVPAKSKPTPAKSAPTKDILSAELDAVTAAARQATATLRTLRDTLPALLSLTAEARIVSVGRLRDGEGDAITAILDTVDAHPGYFTALADRDGGSDDSVVETGPSRDALAKAQALAPLARELDSLATAVGDTLLELNGAAREFSIAAYGIARPVSKQDAKLRRALAKALDFYSSAARTGRRTAGKTPEAPKPTK